jgi:hypothetical protein
MNRAAAGWWCFCSRPWQLLSDAVAAAEQRLVAIAHLSACSRARGSRMADGGREGMSERGARLGEAVWTGSDTI